MKKFHVHFLMVIMLLSVSVIPANAAGTDYYVSPSEP
jgi:hypothetical protein